MILPSKYCTVALMLAFISLEAGHSSIHCLYRVKEREAMANLKRSSVYCDTVKVLQRFAFPLCDNYFQYHQYWTKEIATKLFPFNYCPRRSSALVQVDHKDTRYLIIWTYNSPIMSRHCHIVMRSVPLKSNVIDSII